MVLRVLTEHIRWFDYEYRARELNTDGTMITEPEGETSVNHAYSGSFSGEIYDGLSGWKEKE